MDKELIIKQTEEFVKKTLENEGTGHDWWHTERVLKLAKIIAEKEKADLFIVQLAALLHDIADWKFHNGDDSAAPKLARQWLEKLNVGEDIISRVCDIIKHVSFKGAEVQNQIKTKEGMCVQDADRLDVLGAIGISRVFAYGGKINRPLYNPNIPPKIHKTFEEYKKHGNSSSINHFYEKILLVKDKLNTETAKKIAEKRHRFTELYLETFFKEWDARDII